jgi:hypothetical protein
LAYDAWDLQDMVLARGVSGQGKFSGLVGIIQGGTVTRAVCRIAVDLLVAFGR